ncbi:MAG: VUT family protein [Clostridia bacterium]|nr:VUT family protein [Clostridia bacterium]
MLKQKIKKEWHEFCVLLKTVPTLVVVLFILSVFSMNLLANKSISIPVDWLALDCGIIVSWFAFFTMDILTKHFGPKAATEITVLAIIVNLFFCLLLFLASLIPGVWGESYVEGSEEIINGALDKTFGGTWYVVLGSTAAFLASAIVNNLSNFGVGKLFKKNPDGLAAYVLRAYVSTAIGQFVDNLIFALVVSHFFFGWSIVQCVTCAVTGMLVELLCEGIFFYPGFYITRRWKKNRVGEEYLNLRKGELQNESSDNGNE